MPQLAKNLRAQQREDGENRMMLQLVQGSRLFAEPFAASKQVQIPFVCARRCCAHHNLVLLSSSKETYLPTTAALEGTFRAKLWYSLGRVETAAALHR